MSKYIKIEEVKPVAIPYYTEKAGRKPRTFAIINIKSDRSIGFIKRYGPWRKICFYPLENTIWDIGCLEEIIEFIKNIKKEKQNG